MTTNNEVGEIAGELEVIISSPFDEGIALNAIEIAGYQVGTAPESVHKRGVLLGIKRDCYLQGLAARKPSGVKAYCPVDECDYWIVFGGHYQPFIKGLYSHFKTHASELRWVDSRVPGGLLDQRLGEAILMSLTQH